jgi:ribonucleotide reductase alpha subunit
MAEVLYRHKDKSGRHFPRIDKKMYKFYCKYADRLNPIIVHERDYLFDTFGAETMIKTYLLKIIDMNSPEKYPTITAERPQHLWLRVAIQPKLTSEDVELTDEMFQSIKTAYDYMSTMVFTHATPTLLNSGLP